MKSVIKSKIGTMKYYKEIEKYNSKLNSRLLAKTKRKKNETPLKWLQRVSAKYEKMKIKEK